MRKRLRAILPQSNAPAEAMLMPKAAPLFSMKQLEPVGEDDDRLAQAHVGLDPDL